MTLEATSIGLAGEYYVLAQLAQRGFVGALTLSNTKAVDILVTDPRRGTFFKIEVKTTIRPPIRERLFGSEPFHVWPMSQKHEDIADTTLFYCFVALRGADSLPRFFIVESAHVACYVRSQHEKWLASRRGPVKETPMRRFRIPVSDPEKFENRWTVFGANPEMG